MSVSLADRKRNTAWARQRREKKIFARIEGELSTATRCPWPVSGGSPCGGPLEITTGAIGETILTCAWCDRRNAGTCRDCPRRVYGAIGRALRCHAHRLEAIRRQLRAYADRNRDEVNRRARASYNDDDVRRRRNEYKRAWRKANRDKVRAQKQRYVEKYRSDPTSKYLRYHAKYRVKYREQKREMERDRLAVLGAMKTPSPKCTHCGKSTRWRPVHRGHAGKPWMVCTACLHPCERKVRLRNRRRALARAKSWLESIPPAKKIKRPPLAAVRGPGWERTCVTPGCDIVLTHRKKKCTRCLARDRELAEQRLAASRGRGRRTDLQRARAVA